MFQFLYNYTCIFRKESESSSKAEEKSGQFIFGQNLTERVMVSTLWIECFCEQGE